jgi:trigger factor
MKVEQTHLDTHEAQLTVTLETEQVEKAMKAAARRLSRQARIPGFRKGKAPYWRVAQAFGENAIFEEALEHLTQDVYKEALDESELDPYGPGSLENVETDPVVLTFTVPLRPKVDLGDYRSVRLPYEMPEVTDEDVNNTLQSLREQRAVVEIVERPAQMGDQLVLDIFGALVPEGQETLDDEEAVPDEDVLVDEDSMDFVLYEDPDRDLLPGFAANLVGMAAGDEKEFALEVSEDFENENLAGRTAFFEVTCEQVSSRTLPELNDTFAADLTDGEQETLLELRMEVRKRLETNAEDEANEPYFEELMEKVIEGATLAYPPMTVDDFVDREIERLDQNLRQRGLTLDDLLRIKKQTREDLAKEYREPAENNLKRALILGEVVDAEELEPNEDDIDEQLKELFGERATELGAGFRDSFRQNMISNRAVKRVIDIGKGLEPAIGPDPKPKLEEKVSSEHVATLDDLRDEATKQDEEETLFPGQRVEGGIVRID